MQKKNIAQIRVHKRRSITQTALHSQLFLFACGIPLFTTNFNKEVENQRVAIYLEGLFMP